jgi:Zn-finger nucleic acid-binding protein
MLTLTERAGVEIDYCPQCRGVWLDRGELDRIIDRSDGYDRGRGLDDNHERYEHDRHGHDDGDDRRRPANDEYHDEPRRKRRGAFSTLADLLGGGDD